MTRWTFVLLTDSTIVKSIEFNWEMWPDMNYGESALRLIDSTNMDTFENDIGIFNLNNFSYPETELVYEVEYVIDLDNHSQLDMLDLTEWYYDKYFSDYLYIKNRSNEDKKIVLKTWSFTIWIDERIVVRFGNTIESSSNWFNQLYCGNGLSDYILNKLVS